MGLIILIVVLLLIFGGGGWGYSRGYYGGGIIGVILSIFLLLFLFGGIGGGFGWRHYGSLVGSAYADTIVPVALAAPSPNPTTVLLDNLLTAVLTAAVVPVAAILSGFLWKLWTKLGLQSTAVSQQNMEAELQTALQFGIAKAIPAIKAAGWDNIGVHNQILNDAASFLTSRYPDRAAQITQGAGLSIRTDGPLTAVKESLLARLPDAITAAAASPATPPEPAPAAPAAPVPSVVVGA